MSAYFRPIIMNAFPETTWESIQRCAVRGVALADSVIRQERWLNWMVGMDQRGDLRRVGVMWSLRDACLAGTLPFTCHDRENTVKNCHHVEIQSQNVYLHVNRTDSRMAMPRDTKLRNDERASNQYDLLKPAILTTSLSEIKRWYGWLTFNADIDGRLTHLAVGLPEDARSEWLDIVDIPIVGSSDFVSDDDEPTPPGPDQLLRFKEDFKKMVEPPENEKEAEDAGTESA